MYFMHNSSPNIHGVGPKPKRIKEPCWKRGFSQIADPGFSRAGRLEARSKAGGIHCVRRLMGLFPSLERQLIFFVPLLEPGLRNLRMREPIPRIFALREPTLRFPALRCPELRCPAFRDPALFEPALRDPPLREPLLLLLLIALMLLIWNTGMRESSLSD